MSDQKDIVDDACEMLGEFIVMIALSTISVLLLFVCIVVVLLRVFGIIEWDWSYIGYSSGGVILLNVFVYYLWSQE